MLVAAQEQLAVADRDRLSTYSLMAFSASTSNAGPALTTVVRPSSLVM